MFLNGVLGHSLNRSGRLLAFSADRLISLQPGGLGFFWQFQTSNRIYPSDRFYCIQELFVSDLVRHATH